MVPLLGKREVIETAKRKNFCVFDDATKFHEFTTRRGIQRRSDYFGNALFARPETPNVESDAVEIRSFDRLAVLASSGSSRGRATGCAGQNGWLRLAAARLPILDLRCEWCRR
jgi:hypothetical protein